MTERFISLDEIAGIVNLFGTLTHNTLDNAIVELAFRRGIETEPEMRQSMIATAIDQYRVVAYPSIGDENNATTNSDLNAAGSANEINEVAMNRLAPGPTAFPTLPAHAEDLPRILETDGQEIDYEAATRAVVNRLRDDATRAIANNDTELITYLLDITYDIETWAGTTPDNTNSVADLRHRLDSALTEQYE
ncbi:hypothetical protein [Haloquadratum walsbyi]|jgi:hypothetical protein|uniref:Uncharacterized protein n=1 Tax=Haloquadratum walsbyi J07HQW2 TaxID=1238425 RepID=U1PVL8_9EURY|nr:hypothetical protein [Haloquadratum walsbyi]ERG96451.1 MAG: hypothetical protein J07HQW2_02930 [Haloquadratum walsbyi J07HQW2]